MQRRPSGCTPALLRLGWTLKKVGRISPKAITPRMVELHFLFPRRRRSRPGGAGQDRKRYRSSSGRPVTRLFGAFEGDPPQHNPAHCAQSPSLVYGWKGMRPNDVDISGVISRSHQPTRQSGTCRQKGTVVHLPCKRERNGTTVPPWLPRGGPLLRSANRRASTHDAQIRLPTPCQTPATRGGTMPARRTGTPFVGRHPPCAQLALLNSYQSMLLSMRARFRGESILWRGRRCRKPAVLQFRALRQRFVRVAWRSPFEIRLLATNAHKSVVTRVSEDGSATAAPSSEMLHPPTP